MAPAKDNWQLPEDFRTTNAYKSRIDSLQSFTNLQVDMPQTDFSQNFIGPKKLDYRDAKRAAEEVLYKMDTRLPQVLGPETLEMDFYKH